MKRFVFVAVPAAVMAAASKADKTSLDSDEGNDRWAASMRRDVPQYLGIL